MDYRAILLSHDGSELADAAIPHAAQLAQATNASVLVLRVVESVADTMVQMTAGTGQGWAATPTTVEVAEEAVAAQHKEADEDLARVEQALLSAGASQVRTSAVEGNAGEAIVDTARQEGCDVIVIATHGRSGIARTLLGSVADYVVRNATCAVLVTRSPDAED